MNDSTPKIYVIAGPNGSGKTTSAKILLPDLLQCHEYVNADSVAAALSPFRPETVAMQAGRLMLERIQYLADQGVSFAFETTLASRTFMGFLNESKTKGYEVNILFLWLEKPEIAIQRVKSRVEQGGHDIPEAVIIRRYFRSVSNFLNEYTNIADNWALHDNSGKYSELIAYKTHDALIHVLDQAIWQQIKGVKNANKNG